MVLTLRQKELVKETWKKVKESGGGNTEVGRLIFLRLFELAPETQNLFPFRDESREELLTSKKLGRHGNNFARHVEKAVMGIDNLYGDVGPKLVALGARHYGYGVVEDHYAVAAQALLDTLEKALGTDFTSEVRDAWVAIYAVIEEAMKEGGRDH